MNMDFIKIATKVAYNWDYTDEGWIDKDPNFRDVLSFFNEFGMTTEQSCQGHLPGEQYEDVTEIMKPYITFESQSGSNLEWIKKSKFFDHSRKGNRGGFLPLKDSIIGHWDEFLLWLKNNKPESLKSKWTY